MSFTSGSDGGGHSLAVVMGGGSFASGSDGGGSFASGSDGGGGHSQTVLGYLKPLI